MFAYPSEFLGTVHITLSPLGTCLLDLRRGSLAVEMTLLRPCMKGNKIESLSGYLHSCPASSMHNNEILVSDYL